MKLKIKKEKKNWIKYGIKTAICAAAVTTVFSFAKINAKADDIWLSEKNGSIYGYNGNFIDYGYTGVAQYQDRWLYVENGEVNFYYTGLAGNDYGWWYIKDGAVDFDFTGIVGNENGWWYVRNGAVDFNYTGMANNEYGWWYFNNGTLNFSYTGMANNEYGWWYYKNGTVDFSYTGMANNENGWWYYNNGSLDFNYTGMANNENGWWYYNNGSLDLNYTGMANNSKGWWYYRNGNIDFDYTGMAENEYGYWYFKNGTVDFSYTGYAKKDGTAYYFNNGRVDYNYTGMAHVGEDKYVYFSDGEVDDSYTGLGSNADGTWYFKKGSVAFDYTGELELDGMRYNVYKGSIDMDSAVNIVEEQNALLIQQNKETSEQNAQLIKENQAAIDNMSYYNYLMMFDRIGGIGDSLMSGGIEGKVDGKWNYVENKNYSWLKQLSKRASADYQHYSVSGLTCKAWWNSECKTQVAEDENGTCNAYYIGLGTNDKNLKDTYANGLGKLTDSKNTDSFVGYYKKIVEYVHETNPSAPIFLLSLFEDNKDAVNYSLMIKNIADLYDYCYYIDVLNESDVHTSDGDVYSYNIHLNTLGYIAMAQNIERITDKVILENASDFANYGMFN